MFSFQKKQIFTFLLTALIVMPVVFLTPLPFGGSEAHALAPLILAGVVGGVAAVVVPVIVGLVYIFFVAIPKFFFGLAGTVFDVLLAFSLNSTVIQNQDFVNQGWIIMRDLSNTFFIFILLYIAISTILQTAGGQTKRLLATLVMVALFMNFSLYITKFVIDVGNVFALEFYANIGTPGPAFVQLTGAPGAIQPHSIATTFLKAFDLEQLGGPGFVDAIAHPFEAIFFFILIGIMYLVATFVFLSAGFLFLGRVVAFWFLMILGPLAFMSMILPYTRGKIWGRWSSELVSQSFFAPIFLFFLYLTVVLAKTSNDLFGAGAATGNDAQIVNFFTTFLNFFALITVLLFGLKTAKSMSGEMGASMLKIGGSVTGAAVGGAAWAGRNTVGRGAKYMEGKFGDRLDQSKTGRFVKSMTLTPVANSSFDVRASKTVQNAQGQVGGINLGAAGGAGGFSKVAKDQERENRETYNRLKDNPAAQAAFVASLRRPFSKLNKETGEAKGFGADVHTKKLMQSLNSTQRTALVENAKTPEDKAYLSKINMGLGDKGVSEADKETLKAKGKKIRKDMKDGILDEDEGEKQLEEIEEQLSSLSSGKSGGTSSKANAAEREKRKGEIGEVLKSYTEGRMTNIEEGKAQIQKFIDDMDADELAELEAPLLNHDMVVPHIRPNDLEKIEKSKKLKRGEMDELYKKIKEKNPETQAYVESRGAPDPRRTARGKYQGTGGAQPKK